MNKAIRKILLFSSLFVLTGCGETIEASSSETSASSEIVNGQTLDKVIGSFEENLNLNVTYKFFEQDKAPGCTTVYTKDGCFSTYRNFEGVSNSGLINLDSTAASNKGVAAGVYTWKKENKILTLGEKIGEGRYQDLYHAPSEISLKKAEYISSFVPEISGQTSGNYFLCQNQEDKTMLVSFAKSLGVYETIMGVEGMNLNYAKIYFGPTSTVVTISVYSSYKGGYDQFETSIICNSFGTAKIAELNTYLGAK